MAPKHHPFVARRHGLTLIEILVAVSIIVLLMALLMPAISLVRKRSHQRIALHTVSELVTAIEAYQDEDVRHRYPPVNADQSISLRLIPGPGDGLLELLDRKGLWSPGEARKDDQSRLLDPFGEPYRYALVRPSPTAPAQALQDWNWDAAAGHERLWSRRPQSDGTIVEGPEAFAYVWSLGSAKSLSDASTWLYVKDAR